MPAKPRVRKRKPRGSAKPPHLGILPSERPGKATHLTSYGDIWFLAFGKGEPPWGELGKWMPALEEVHGREEVIRRFQNYCGATIARFASVTKFAQTWGGWERGDDQRRDGLAAFPGEDVDAYIMRMGSRR